MNFDSSIYSYGMCKIDCSLKISASINVCNFIYKFKKATLYCKSVKRVHKQRTLRHKKSVTPFTYKVCHVHDCGDKKDPCHATEDSLVHDDSVMEPIKVRSWFIFSTENTCELDGELAIKFSSLAFVLLPTPIEMMLTEESFSFLIGPFNLLIPHELCPSVTITRTYSQIVSGISHICSCASHQI